MIGQHGFRAADREDLAQELALHTFLAAPRYEPEVGPPGTYYNQVLSRKATDLALHNTRACRDRRREVPLELAGGLAAPPEQRARTADLRMDLPAALATLPGDARRLAALLGRFPLAEAARRAGLTRQQARGLQARIGRHLRESGVAA